MKNILFIITFLSLILILSSESFAKTYNQIASEPDTSISVEGDVIISNYYDHQDGKMKELKIMMKDNEINKVFLNGNKLSSSEQKEYQKQIDYTLESVEKARCLAINENQSPDEDFSVVTDQLRNMIENIQINGIEEIQLEIEKVMNEVQRMKNENTDHNTDEILKTIEAIDWEEFGRQIEEIDKVIIESIQMIDEEGRLNAIERSNEIEAIEDIEEAESEENHDIKSKNPEKENQMEQKLRELEKKE